MHPFSFKKVLIFFLLLFFLLALGVSGFYFYRNKSPLPSSDKRLGTMSKDNRLKGYDIDIHPAVDYANQVLKPEYVPASLPTAMLFFPYSNLSMSWYKSNTWTASKKNVSLEGWQTIKGDKYDKSFAPLEYNVWLKDSIPANLSNKDKFGLLDKYFFNSLVKLNTLEIKEISSPAQKIRDIFAADEFGARKPVKETAIGESKILEGVWKNNSGELESRTVWTISSTGDSETVYFIACRVFPLSNNYQRNTCVGGN